MNVFVGWENLFLPKITEGGRVIEVGKVINIEGHRKPERK